MLSLMTKKRAQKTLSQACRKQRLHLGYTQAALAKRADVSLGSLRKFEQSGEISLSSYLKLQMVLGTLDKLTKAMTSDDHDFSSIDDVLKANEPNSGQTRKRGWRA